MNELGIHKFKRSLWISLVSALIGAGSVFVMILRNRGQNVGWKNLFSFVIPFIVCFVLGNLGFRKWEEHLLGKLDERFDDEEK